MSEPVKKASIFKVILPVVMILVAVVGALSLLKKKGGGDSHPVVKEGEIIPDVSMQIFGGSAIKISEVKGKVILMNFWASWCQACIVEMPSIVRLWKSYREKGLEVLAVNVDENPQAVIPGLAKRLSMEFPIVVDTDNKLADVFDVHAIPTTVIFDRGRKVLLLESGERDWNGADVREQMNRWLIEK